jgi:hypothetical protein
MKLIQKNPSLMETLVEPFRFTWPVFLLLVSALAGMIAFPKVDFNGPDGLYITTAFFFVGVEAYRIGIGTSKRTRGRKEEGRVSCAHNTWRNSANES